VGASSIDGYFQFISGVLLSASGPILHTLEDDLESIVHVATWLGMRFMSNNLKDCAARLAAMFDEIIPHAKGTHTGGTTKKQYLVNPLFSDLTTGKLQRLQIEHNKPYSILLYDLAKLFSDRYAMRKRRLLTGTTLLPHGRWSQASGYPTHSRQL
jgi:hypothetical protein